MGRSTAAWLKSRSATSNVSFSHVKSALDIPDLVLLAREAHEESRFSYIPFSEEKVFQIAMKALEDPARHGGFLARSKGEPVGFAYCTIGEYHIGTGALLTTVHSMGVSQTTRKRLMGGKVALGLFQGVRSWSKDRGAQEVLLHFTTGVGTARSAKLARKLGFQLIGGSYVNKL